MTDKEKKSTMKGFATNDQADYYSEITSITVNGKNAYELQGKFLDDLHINAFSRANGEDAVEHIDYFLRIVNPIDLPNVNQDKLRVVVFPISLVQNVVYFNDLFPFNIIYPDDLKSDKNNDDNEIDMIQSSEGWRSQKNVAEAKDLAERMRMVYTRDDGQEVFVSHAWRWLFEIRAPLVHEFLLEFFITYKIGDAMGLDTAGLHTAEEMVEDRFRAY
ncbi:hypothetical protein Tco_0935480 [Tanacetum coccineum]